MIAAAVVETGAWQLQPGDSREQREAEAFIIRAVSALVGASLQKARFQLPDGSRCEVDGYSAEAAVLCEAWAHIGPPKSAQKHKVMTDAMKLTVLRATQLPGGMGRTILAFCDEQAAGHFVGGSWMAEALRQLAIEVMVVAIPDATREMVLRAQERQYR